MQPPGGHDAPDAPEDAPTIIQECLPSLQHDYAENHRLVYQGAYPKATFSIATKMDLWIAVIVGS